MLEFIKENVKPDARQDDVDFYGDLLEDLKLNVVNDTKLLDKRNIPSLIGVIAYACENDIDVDSWFVDYFGLYKKYELNQKSNYLHMKDNLLKYLKEGLVV